MLKNKWTVIYLAKFIINNYQLFGELLREKFTKKKVLNDMKKLINDFQDDINVIFLIILMIQYITI